MPKKPSMPLISIVMPSFNQGRFIEESIESVLAQSYPNKELIILDNLSNDNTPSVLSKYQKKARIIIGKDNGQTDAINRGMKLAKGEIVTYLNSDDVYEKDAFKKVVEYFSENPNSKIVYGQGRFIDAKGKKVGDYKTSSPTLSNLFKECVISQPTVFIKREVYEKIGRFDDKLTYAMDYDYWIRVARDYTFGYIDSYLASTRLHSMTKTSQSKKVFEEILYVLKKNYGKVSDEAVFNFAYNFAPHDRTGILNCAAKTYLRFRQLPGKTGIRHFLILLKNLHEKKLA